MGEGLGGGGGGSEREGPAAAAAAPTPAAHLGPPGVAGVEESGVGRAGGVGAEAEREGELQLVRLLRLLRPALAGGGRAPSPSPSPRGGRWGQVERVVAGGRDGAPGAVAAAAAGLALQNRRGHGGRRVVRELRQQRVAGAPAPAGGRQLHDRQTLPSCSLP